LLQTTELACAVLQPDEADLMRNEVAGIIRTAKMPKSNLKKEEIKALSELRKNNSITIIPADKGRATVVMVKSEYDGKVTAMLQDEKTYEKLKSDPTSGYKRKLVAILTRLKNEEKLSKSQYDGLYPTSEKIPQMYCLPKIHKKGTPLRPIVDYTGSIGYNTSRMLADILAPLVGKTECHVKNSGHLKEMLADLHLADDEMLVSHDVVSLFTNIPIEAALEVIKDKLETDDTWKDFTALEVEDIIELLCFVPSTTYFSGDKYTDRNLVQLWVVRYRR